MAHWLGTTSLISLKIRRLRLAIFETIDAYTIVQYHPRAVGLQQLICDLLRGRRRDAVGLAALDEAPQV